MHHKFIIVFFVFIAGCGTDHTEISISRFNKEIDSKTRTYALPNIEKTSYSLYCNNAEKASLFADRRRLLKYENGIKVYWAKRRNSVITRKFDPYSVSKKCIQYFNNDSIEKFSYEKYRSFFEAKSGLAKADLASINRKYLRAAFEKGFIAAERTNKRYYIVCLEPLVVVGFEVDNVSWNRVFSYRCKYHDVLYYYRESDGYFYRYDPLNEYRGRVEFSSNMDLIASGIVLPGGLDFGLQFTYAEKPFWFSPDMKVKSRPVEMLSKTRGRIEVPWGYLYLTKQNDNWVVTAKKNNIERAVKQHGLKNRFLPILSAKRTSGVVSLLRNRRYRNG